MDSGTGRATAAVRQALQLLTLRGHASPPRRPIGNGSLWFAALNYLDGKIFSLTAPEHAHHAAPTDLTLHLIVDNYSTHKHPKVKSWLRWRNARQRGCPWRRAHDLALHTHLQLVDEPH